MKKRVISILSVLIVSVAGLVAAGVAYLHLAFPKVGPATQIVVESTPERVTRGKYLAHHVTGCMDCHSDRDFSRFSGPVVPGTEGKGGAPYFDQKMGLPGHFFPPNLTPAALSSWTDGEILRAMTEGVSRDGRPLFPFMPYLALAGLSREDAYSIIAYLRTLKPIANEVPKSQLDFPVSLLVRTMPAPAQLRETTPKPSDGVAYGEYVTRIAGCTDCHTPMDKGTPIPGMTFAGGMTFAMPGGAVARSANLTPDAETGIGSWTRAAFIQRFRSPLTGPVAEGGVNTPMPWELMSGMTDDDLGAIYDYLRTIPPVKNSVQRLTAAPTKTAQR